MTKCNGKNLYSKKEALTNMNYQLSIGKADTLSIYQCSRCGHWHLTKKIQLKNGHAVRPWKGRRR